MRNRTSATPGRGRREVMDRTNESQDHPPSREGLSDAEVWEWAEDHWRVRRIAAFEEPNAGGSPAPVDEP
jgi:hypothetical protein